VRRLAEQADDGALGRAPDRELGTAAPPVKSSGVPLQGQLVFGSEVRLMWRVRGAGTSERVGHAWR
jgi:hypothetical protein